MSRTDLDNFDRVMAELGNLIKSGKLEDGPLVGQTAADLIACSTAISLKRVADHLTADRIDVDMLMRMQVKRIADSLTNMEGRTK